MKSTMVLVLLAGVHAAARICLARPVQSRSDRDASSRRARAGLRLAEPWTLLFVHRECVSGDPFRGQVYSGFTGCTPTSLDGYDFYLQGEEIPSSAFAVIDVVIE